MAHCGNLGNRRVSEGLHDVRGTTVRGADGEKLGKISDVVFDHDNMAIRYVVVDSGGWLSGGVFLLPANRLTVDEQHGNGLATGTTQKQIKNSPQYKKESLRSDGEWKKYEQQFKKYWEEQPVMHIKGSDRIITPPEEPELVRANSSASTTQASGGGVNAAELFPERMTSVFSDPEPGGSKVTMRPQPVARVEEAAAGVNQLKPRWWDAFENYLRMNKDDIQAGCSQCSSKAA